MKSPSNINPEANNPSPRPSPLMKGRGERVSLVDAGEGLGFASVN
jgi:hypothetical protein